MLRLACIAAISALASGFVAPAIVAPKSGVCTISMNEAAAKAAWLAKADDKGNWGQPALAARMPTIAAPAPAVAPVAAAPVPVAAPRAVTAAPVPAAVSMARRILADAKPAASVASMTTHAAPRSTSSEEAAKRSWLAKMEDKGAWKTGAATTSVARSVVARRSASTVVGRVLPTRTDGWGHSPREAFNDYMAQNDLLKVL